MYKIVIQGEASTDYKDLKALDGIGCQDCFSEYLDNDNTYSKDISGGYMSFKLEGNKLYTITDYDSKRELTEEELLSLAKYTQGQWSDGIGEGFEQNPCIIIEDEEVYISPWQP